MWILKYIICLVHRHIWVGSRYHYCLRCGKLEIGLEDSQDHLIKQIQDF